LLDRSPMVYDAGTAGPARGSRPSTRGARAACVSTSPLVRSHAVRVATRDAGGRIDGQLSYRCGDTSRPLVEQTIGDALRAAAAEVPDRPAVVEGSPGPGLRRRLSYAELLSRAERVEVVPGLVEVEAAVPP